MEIKEFVKDKVKDLPHAISSTTMKGTEYGYTLMTSEIEDIAKEFALEMCKQTVNNIDRSTEWLDTEAQYQQFIPSQLTATKLEGEK